MIYFKREIDKAQKADANGKYLTGDELQWKMLKDAPMFEVAYSAEHPLGEIKKIAKL